MIRTQLLLLMTTVIASAILPVHGVGAQTRPRDTVAQGTTSVALPVRTFTLRQLAVKDAAKLLAPYLQSPRSGLFETGTNLGAITIRGTEQELQLADSLLTQFDRAPRTVRLRFQFIEPVQDSTRDPRIREVAGALRELFDAPGYQLLGEGMVVTDEARAFDVSISAGSTPLHATGMVQRADSGDRDVRLRVDIYQNSSAVTNPSMRPLFSGSVSVPLGQLVVLGSAVPLIFADRASDSALERAGVTRELYSQRTIILTVLPQLEGKP